MLDRILDRDDPIPRSHAIGHGIDLSLPGGIAVPTPRPMVRARVDPTRVFEATEDPRALVVVVIEGDDLERMLRLELHEAYEGLELDCEWDVGAQRVEEEARGSGHSAVRPSSRVTPA